MDSWWLVSGGCHINDDGDSEIQGSSTCSLRGGVFAKHKCTQAVSLLPGWRVQRKVTNAGNIDGN